jgi:hypothetical protein
MGGGGFSHPTQREELRIHVDDPSELSIVKTRGTRDGDELRIPFPIFREVDSPVFRRHQSPPPRRGWILAIS